MGYRNDVINGLKRCFALILLIFCYHHGLLLIQKCIPSCEGIVKTCFRWLGLSWCQTRGSKKKILIFLNPPYQCVYTSRFKISSETGRFPNRYHCLRSHQVFIIKLLALCKYLKVGSFLTYWIFHNTHTGACCCSYFPRSSPFRSGRCWLSRFFISRFLHLNYNVSVRGIFKRCPIGVIELTQRCIN